MSVKEAKDKEMAITAARVRFEKNGWRAVKEHRNHAVHGLVVNVTMVKGTTKEFLGWYPDYAHVA